LISLVIDSIAKKDNKIILVEVKNNKNFNMEKIKQKESIEQLSKAGCKIFVKFN
jgi:Holliday junction resolvase-like predicted endonuclease